MSPRAIRWALLALVGLGLVATLVVVSLVEPPRSRREAAAAAASEAPPLLGQAPDFDLVDRSGRRVAASDLLGEVWVADFIFTRCGDSCPRLTSTMVRLGTEVEGLRRVSISVDPDYDTPSVLADYASAYSIDDPEWLFLTGSAEEIRRAVVDGFKLPVDAGPSHEMTHSTEPIVHSDRIVLVDAQGAIRGYYEATAAEGYGRLRRDIGALGGERTELRAEDAEPLAAACEGEIVDLHRFIEQWKNGALPQSEEAFGRFADALAPQFVLVDPGGEALDRAAVLEAMRRGYGQQAEQNVTITIENPTVRYVTGASCVMTYEEWHAVGSSSRGRLSTVLFRRRAGAPRGVEWLHLHETWLPQQADKTDGEKAR